jgi:hypothetical protein
MGGEFHLADPIYLKLAEGCLSLSSDPPVSKVIAARSE